MIERTDPSSLIQYLAKGRPPNNRLLSTFTTLLSQQAMQYAYPTLTDNDLFQTAISGKFSTDLWRTWRRARGSLASNRLLEAAERMREFKELYPAGDSRENLPQLEWLLLRAEIAEEFNDIPKAVNALELAKHRLDQLVNQVTEDPAALANELKTMLQILGNLAKLDPDITDQALIDGWLLGRGFDVIGIISSKQAQLLLAGQLHEQGRRVAESLEDNLRLLHEAVPLALGKDKLASVAMRLGEAWTLLDDERSFQYFELVVSLLGIEQGIMAASSAANALFRLENYEEAEYRYTILESLFERFGMLKEAARVWVYQNMANWKRRHNPDIRHSLVGAIKFYEENISRKIVGGVDPMTLFSVKKYIENGYLLLATVLVTLQDDSPEHHDELLRVLRAIYTRDQNADLESELAEPGWQNILEQQQSPLLVMQNALRPFPQRAVVHLLSGISCLIWIAYGYDASGEFHLKSCLGDEDQAKDLVRFLEEMQKQQVLDLVDDSAGINKTNTHMEEIGNQIGAKLTKPFAEFLLSMKQIHYMPHSFGSLDEFPLAGMRLEGKWLCEYMEIMRTPSVSHLREMLSPNRTTIIGRPNGAILLGDPKTGGPALQKALNHAAWVDNAWKQVYRLQTEMPKSTSLEQVHNWLEGQVSMIHYVGHGFANVMSEGLPLGEGMTFTLSNIDQISGPHTPFVFLCACEAGRVRYGHGGYEAGIASKLASRGAPAVLAFLMPIPEIRAYRIAEQFYREASSMPVGQAMQKTRNIVSTKIPAYTWLAWVAYGDPVFRLWEIAREGRVTGTSLLATSWHSALRNYAVLRTAEAEQLARKRLGECPASLREIAERLMDTAFKETPITSQEALDKMETRLLDLTEKEPVGTLTLRGLIILERAHRIGLDTLPIFIPQEPENVHRLFHGLMFVLLTGSAFFDMRFHGFGHAMIGRLLTIDQSETQHSRIYVEQGLEKLLECEPISPFVERIRSENKELLKIFPTQNKARTKS